EHLKIDVRYDGHRERCSKTNGKIFVRYSERCERWRTANQPRFIASCEENGLE
ncbi:hypothetical protein U1Q18_051015, partial [Sarracenia purpurea var. burkii]